MTQETLERPDTVPGLGADLFSKAIALRLEFRRLGTSRKVDSGEVTTDADKDVIHVGKDILEAESLDAIAKADADLRKWTHARSVPMKGARVIANGVHLVSLEMFAEVAERVNAYAERERPELVETFIRNDYQNAIDTARGRLGSLFDATDYPEPAAVRAQFSVYAQWIEFGAPKVLQAVSAQTFAKEQARIAQDFDRALDAARAALRAELADMVGRLAAAVEPTDDGKPRRFKATTVDNLKEWIGLMRGRDLTDDFELRALASSLDRTLSGVSAEKLRDSATLRDMVREQLNPAKDLIAQLTEAKPSRQYGNDD